jgi:hypothetical protein
MSPKKAKSSKQPSRSRSKATSRTPGRPVPIGTVTDEEPRASARKASSGKTPSAKTSTGSGSTSSGDGSGDSFRAERLANSRYGIVYDIDGPRVRLGVAWFVVAIVATYVGLVTLTLVVAAVAALAAAQTAQTLRARWCRPSRATAAAMAASVPIAAAFGTALAGIALIVGAIASVVLAATRTPRRSDPVVDAGAVVRSATFVGLAAASVVMLYRIDIGAAVMLILIVSAYETGDYLIGSGASNTIEGPFSGSLAIVVITGAAAVAQPPPFTSIGLWFYALVAAVSAPVGQMLASAILPRAGASAAALRRLDSYLLTGPAWLVLLWTGVGI